MMKKHLFLSFFLLFAVFGFSQSQRNHYTPFPEDSAQWSIWECGHDIYGQFYIKSFQLKMFRDTVINGISYNKIYKSPDLQYPAPSDKLHCFIRQDTALRKVYVKYPYNIYPDTNEFLLYDFDLQLGDTVYIKLIGSGNSYPAAVMSIVDSVQFNNGEYRRLFSLMFHTPPPLTYIWGPACDNGPCMGWNEGMGSGCHLLETEINEGECFVRDYTLQCFWHKGVYIAGGVLCNHFLLTDEFKKTERNDIINIYPNPANDIVSIKNTTNDKQVLFKIWNFLGQVKYIGSLSRHEEIRLDLASFSPGLYYVEGRTLDGMIQCFKLIIQH